MIEFLLHRELVQVADHQGQRTVLDFLRNERHLTGTKEGCASGDCGACTAVLGMAVGDTIQYRHFNSCITFLGAIHGKQLLTVDHLKQDGQLHPVQQAMVDYHGSQCGFCTPGFVMSLLALHKDRDPEWDEQQARHKIDEYLAGNLCRCTGYRPIIDAGRAVLAQAQADCFDHDAKTVVATLVAIAPDPDNGHFLRPRSAAELATVLEAEPGTRLLGGGTDLALEVTQQLCYPEKIAYLGAIPELTAIVENDHETRIGAAVNLLAIENLLGDRYPELKTLLHRFGSRQIRGQATIGGNIANASPIGDLPPVLIALNANLELQQASGIRTVGIESFFTGYRTTALSAGEFIRAVVIPTPTADSQLKIYKLSKRMDDDISALCVACNIGLVDGVVETLGMAFGGMAAIAKRATHCEQAVRGNPLNDAVIARAGQALAQDFQPIDDVRASATYRLRAAQNLLRRLLLELTAPEVATQVSTIKPTALEA